MSLALILKGIGWVFVIIPLIIYIVISFSMLKGFANDDEHIKGFFLMGITIFLMGGILLLLLYLTDFFPLLLGV